MAAGRLFGDVFGHNSMAVRAHGNVLTAISFLHGLAAEELAAGELDYDDPEYECVITVKATKPHPSEAAL